LRSIAFHERNQKPASQARPVVLNDKIDQGITASLSICLRANLATFDHSQSLGIRLHAQPGTKLLEVLYKF
jgi:hypothetical protein